MSLEPGSSLSHYRLLQSLGQGGMGVVWRAHDTTLGRDVALKVLPDLFAHDPERLSRFEREARLLASLNHPHIASIYGLHTSEGVRFLAMELVEGEDLAVRAARGPIPIDESLRLALQIGQALEHAHEKGIVHRDLKPANVMLGPGGAAKVLDFGLAKALAGDPSDPTTSSSISQSPTLTGLTTGTSALLGTAAYMAPEQARGQVADRRADIWAFGVLLLEMLTGKRVFEGETVSDTLASVLKSDPDWEALPPETPRRLRELLRRCLERDPRRRLRDIGEARIVIEDVIAGAADPLVRTAAAPTSAPGRRMPVWLPIAALAAGVVVTLAVTQLGRPARSTVPLRKFRIVTPVPDATPRSPVLSPDGSKLAYLAADRLWVQDFSELEPREIAVEPGAIAPFWSPDGKGLGYVVGTKIHKVTLASGESQVLCDTRAGFTGGAGAVWLEDGSIVFSRGDTLGLLQVSSRGGDPRPLVPLLAEEGDLHEPSALPGDRGLIFGVHNRTGGVDRLALWVDGKRKELVHLPEQYLYNPSYSPTGHILFRRTPTTPGIWALPFSLSKLEATGEPFLVVPDAQSPSVAADGTLSYLGGEASSNTQLVWFDRAGLELGPVGPARTDASWLFDVAPDGVSIVRAENENDNLDLWIYDTARGTRTRLTFDDAREDSPDWSPDGRRIAYHTSPRGCSGTNCFSIVSRLADGTGTVDTLGSGVLPHYSADGRSVSWTAFEGNGSRWDLVTLDLASGQGPRTLVRGNPRVVCGAVSAGSRWMAYMSSESGEWEVYLTRFPSGEGRWQVSNSGGQWPHWNRRGDRLFFVHGEEVMEVDVAGESAPVLGVPHKLFTRPALGAWLFGWSSGLGVDGEKERFLVARPVGDRARAPGVTVVQSWVTEFLESRAD